MSGFFGYSDICIYIYLCMKIEEAIQQKKFESEYHKLVINILYTSGWLSSKSLAVFKPYGISSQQYNILRILRGQYPNPASIGLLTERMLDKMSNASRLVDKLVQKGMVERAACPADRRQVDVRITSQGLELLEQIQVPNQQFIEDLDGLDVTEAKQLNELLDKLRNKE